MNRWRRIFLIGLGLVFGAAAFFSTQKLFIRQGLEDSKTVINRTWEGYKHFFIDEKGRVMRPKENDTVSEGQAYGMLRAVWMGDKETFDRCYRWSEQHLSRKKTQGDHLLAWHWKAGAVTDWMPASDADIDYALSLIFAAAHWQSGAPTDLEDYGRKAKAVLADILKKLTYRTSSGRLYLSPWILEAPSERKYFPVNPSYYSPAHFRIFHRFSGDERWLDLLETTYGVLNSLSREFNGQKGKGLIPDWCRVDLDDQFSVLEGKPSGFGWEAVRVPMRVAMDYYWFGSREARDYFHEGFAPWVAAEWKRQGAVFCEYDYAGVSRNPYENALFYGAYTLALAIDGSEWAPALREKTRQRLQKKESYWVYEDEQSYYTNSLAWFPEGFKSKTIRVIQEP